MQATRGAHPQRADTNCIRKIVILLTTGTQSQFVNQVRGHRQLRPGNVAGLHVLLVVSSNDVDVLLELTGLPTHNAAEDDGDNAVSTP